MDKSLTWAHSDAIGVLSMSAVPGDSNDRAAAFIGSLSCRATIVNICSAAVGNVWSGRKTPKIQRSRTSIVVSQRIIPARSPIMG